MNRESTSRRMCSGIRQLLLLHLFLMEILYTKGTKTDCETGQFKCKNGRCIPTPWRCDDDDDCSDNSDEDNCPKKTCASTDFACKNGQCVPARWRCDGEPECSDGSDEADFTCSRQTCPPEKFDCGGTTNKCVSLSWRCDGETDCENGADEDQCAADAKACPPKEFQCRSGLCVAPTFVCDGDDDCGDGSDEEKCAAGMAITCGPHEFHCGGGGECVPKLWTCDGDPDCGDGSDEAPAHCSHRAEPPRPRCPAGEFQCTSGECVHLNWKCDGDADCKDKSDEANCPLLTCRPDEFQCGDGSCIHGTKQCNHVHDCPDFSDEAGCINKTGKCEGPHKFLCKSGECIDTNKVCDNIRDCKDWSDEPMKECGLNECVNSNGGCSHMCRDRRIGYECECPSGYKLLDKKTCADIDECENPDVCSQICINYKGDYKCECYEGYEMDPVTKTCKAVGSSPYLMFTNRHEIRRLDLVKRDYTQVVPTLKNAVALDVDVTTNKMYWCDLFHRKIFSAYINKASNASEQITLIESALHSPEGIAVDWVHKNIYWTDSGHKTISVATNDGKKRKILIDTELSEPRAIAVDPRQGFMYWSDWGTQAKIEKAGLNGVDRQLLVSERIEWPNGITLDLSSRRLYWVDSKLHLISSVDLNGDDRRVLLSSVNHLGHPFALTLFEDRVYWTDLEDEAIYSVDRLTGHDVALLAQHLNNPLDVVVFHELRQPKAPDSCNMGSLPNGGCEYLCLKAPQITEHSPKYTCACPDGGELGPDMRRCVAVEKPKTTTAPPSITTTTEPATTTRASAATTSTTIYYYSTTPTPTMSSATPARTGTHSTTPPAPSTSTSSSTTYSPTDSSSTVSTTHTSTTLPWQWPASTGRVAAGSSQTFGLSTISPANREHGENTNLSHRAASDRFLLGNNITVAVLGIVIPIVVVGLLCTGGYLVWRNWRRRNTKSMNFDNPVYRKTTEDDDDDEIHIGRSEQIGHVYPAVSGSARQPFLTLPLGGAITDPAAHWYSGAPMLSSMK
ncbi:low-density lipoprotein receptor-related protein 8 isoform X2 [Electrophorus electricus]|uniref:low-density lipoprotein receptor-related protein 8 isoform X2 n=1 Tax=Electrophorus electricus TaxID=8005 RepID=UPI0015D0ADEA|nr:low-density lipoprotein receptor-related protein 8 isoform X2 [Electrophorus electricus]